LPMSALGQKRTSEHVRSMSALCQKRTHAVQQLGSLLDNVVRDAEQRRRQREPEHATNRTGMDLVSVFAARPDGKPPPATITATCRRTNSAASVWSRSV